tara:strand:+ start:870 stop:1244 length:375 start_codon:yes stop_codon:yes gene_type:complete
MELQMKEDIKELISIIEQINVLKMELKKLSEVKSRCENKLLEDLASDTEIETNKYIISCNEKKTYQSVSKEFLKSKIDNYIKEGLVLNSDKIIEYLYNSRKVTSKTIINIKRKSAKSKVKKDYK